MKRKRDIRGVLRIGPIITLTLSAVTTIAAIANLIEHGSVAFTVLFFALAVMGLYLSASFIAFRRRLLRRYGERG